tara:strand:+ start:826 stop:984 length:159 start_codon:yes stop_codon:yes gene_type:complete
MSELSIVERSSGYWIVDDDGVAWDEPFDDLTEATKKLAEIKDDDTEGSHLWP